jgi:hypothetical protein
MKSQPVNIKMKANPKTPPTISKIRFTASKAGFAGLVDCSRVSSLPVGQCSPANVT